MVKDVTDADAADALVVELFSVGLKIADEGHLGTSSDVGVACVRVACALGTCTSKTKISTFDS